MKLTGVKIENFRSIEEQTLDFTYGCQVLVGVNESGKSNILKALSLIGNDYQLENDDIRQPGKDEEEVTSATVRFHFALDENDVEYIRDCFEEASYDVSSRTAKIFEDEKGEKYTVGQFCNSFFSKVFFQVTDNDRNGAPGCFLTPNIKFCTGNWKKVKAECPESITFDDGKVHKLKDFIFINADGFGNIFDNYVEEVGEKDIKYFFAKAVKTFVSEELPQVIYWQYKDEHILPSKVNIEEFKNDSTICIPLKHMFELHGITDVKKAIESASAQSKGIKNLLDRVAEKSTRHLKTIWKEHRGVSFGLSPNGNFIDISIDDAHNSFDMKQRSDGFKRFVSFLLHISAKVRSGALLNTLILVDEADFGLHPKGARYLMEELIKIGGNNRVIYSTHSIFMVDNEQIDRHLIVSKEKEITIIERANEGNIVKEDLLYKALGFTYLEILPDRNILFEGWWDKVLYRTALKSPRGAALIEKFKGINDCHLGGIKKVPEFTAILELARRQCVVLSDADEVAIEHKKKFETEKGYGKWQTYTDVDKSIEAKTGEDFLDGEHVLKKTNEVLIKNEVGVIASIPTHGRMSMIKNHLEDTVDEKEKRDRIVRDVKTLIFEELKSEHILDVYFKYLKKITV